MAKTLIDYMSLPAALELEDVVDKSRDAILEKLDTTVQARELEVRIVIRDRMNPGYVLYSIEGHTA